MQMQQCEVCEKHFEFYHQVAAHKNTNCHWSCLTCKEQFATRILLEQHNQQKHDDAWEPIDDKYLKQQAQSGSDYGSDYSQDSFEDFAELFDQDVDDQKSGNDSIEEIEYMPFSRNFLKDDLEKTKVQINLHYSDLKELVNIDMLLTCYERVCQKNRKLKAEALDKQMEILDLYQEMEEIKTTQEKTKQVMKDVSQKINDYHVNFESIKQDTKFECDSLILKLEHLINQVKEFVQDDDQPKIKRALEKHDEQGTHLYIDYEVKVFNLTKLIKLGSQYLKEAKELEEQAECCCICLDKFTPQNTKSVQICGHSNFHADCIAKWKQMSDKCPLCNHNI